MYKLLDGNTISKELIESYKKQISLLKDNNKHIVLSDVIVGCDDASKIYIENKKKKFNDLGIIFNEISLSKDITENELLLIIEELNSDNNVNGIFLELPLLNNINESKIVDKINPNKDVDGFNKVNLGKLLQGDNGLFPCTALGIIELLKRYNIIIEGKNCVVVGRSNIVGKPVALMMLKENATVTICHSKTTNLKEICNNADILIVATGKAKSIDDSYVKDGAVVVDVGIHKIVNDGKSTICGDVDFEKVAPKTSYITPVPGGVGPMTIAMLVKNCIYTLNYE